MQEVDKGYKEVLRYLYFLMVYLDTKQSISILRIFLAKSITYCYNGRFLLVGIVL